MDTINLHLGIVGSLLNMQGQIALIACSLEGEESKILEISRGAEVLTGYRRDEIIGQPIALLHEAGDLEHMALIESALSQGQEAGFKMDLKIRHKSGEFIPVNLAIEPIFDANKDLIAVLGIANDLRQSESAKQEILKSEEKFRTLFEGSTDALLILDGERFTDYNPAALEMLGATKDQIAAAPPWELSPPFQPDGMDSGEKAVLMIEKAWENGSHRFEWTHRRMNGENFPVEVILTPVSFGDKKVLYTVWRDITKRKAAEKKLREAEERFRVITENSLDMIWIRDLELNITYLSPAVERVKGYSVEAGMKLRLEEYIKPEYVARVYALVEEEFKKEMDPTVDPNRTITFQVEEKCSDGRWIWTESIISFIRDDHGLPIGVLGITRDVSERVKLMEDLKLAKEKAEESDRLKSAFVANMSHEIRTPMNSILGFSELLIENSVTEEERHKYASIIQSSSSQLLSIISDIIDISKIEALQMELYPTEVNLETLFGELFEQYTRIIQKRNFNDLVFSRECDGESCRIPLFVDPNRFRQILINLLDNALKFTPEGEISFGCRKGAPGFLEFYVRDTGIGISGENIDRVFDRFYQDKGPGNVIGGTGLGLSICKSLVEMMGGTIQVQSRKHQGSEFWFSLPLDSKK